MIPDYGWGNADSWFVAEILVDVAAECVFPQRSGELQENAVSICNEMLFVPFKKGHSCLWLILP